jgi:hypothetical protein
VKGQSMYQVFWEMLMFIAVTWGRLVRTKVSTTALIKVIYVSYNNSAATLISGKLSQILVLNSICNFRYNAW